MLRKYMKYKNIRNEFEENTKKDWKKFKVNMLSNNLNIDEKESKYLLIDNLIKDIKYKNKFSNLNPYYQRYLFSILSSEYKSK